MRNLATRLLLLLAVIGNAVVVFEPAGELQPLLAEGFRMPQWRAGHRHWLPGLQPLQDVAHALLLQAIDGLDRRRGLGHAARQLRIAGLAEPVSAGAFN